MKKLLPLVITVLSCAQLLSQQTWLPLSTGTGFGSLLSTPRVRAFTTYNNKLIVGGGFGTAGGNATNYVAAWDGTNWSTLGNGLNQNNTNTVFGCTGLVVYNTDLYACGDLGAVGTSTWSTLAKWNGSSWSNMINKITAGWNSTGLIHALTVYNNKLIVCGVFDTINGVPVKGIAQWNGTAWSPLGTGINLTFGGYDAVKSLYVFNNELYAGGQFSFTASGNQVAKNIAKWNGTQWSALGSGIPNCNSGYDAWQVGVTSLGSYSNQLYAGNCSTGISKWNGTSWQTVGGGLNSFGAAFAMTNYDNKLIIGGDFSTAGIHFRSNIAAWDGNDWSFLGGTDVSNGLSAPIYALANYNLQLYCGGDFGGGLPPLNHIAYYFGAVGIKENSLVSLCRISPNPSAGLFTFEGLNESCFVEVTDLTGRVIYRDQLDESNNTINLQGMNSGLYLYKLKNKLNYIQQGKLILE